MTLVFEDAGDEQTGKEKEGGAEEKQHPAVASWYPILYDGEVSTSLVHESLEGTLGANYLRAGAEAKLGQGKEYVSLDGAVALFPPQSSRSCTSLLLLED